MLALLSLLSSRGSPTPGTSLALVCVAGRALLPKRLLTHVVILQLLLRVINLKATSSLLLLPSLLHSLLLVPERARGRNKQTKELHGLLHRPPSPPAGAG